MRTEPPAPQLHPDRNLALELVRATEAAAIRAVPFIGKGDKNAADGAAVDAMRSFLATVNFAGTVVIGEGEKDNAPMLYNGEVVGTGRGPECDIAVDPIDGTSLTAAGRRNAISMIAASDRGTMLDASSVFYMDKLVTGPDGVGVVDIRKPVAENIRALAKAKRKDVSELSIGVLDRPRHEGLIDEIRAAGAGTRLLLDGDVAGGIDAASYEGRIDMCVGIGGSPESAATACAIKALGGSSRPGWRRRTTTRRSAAHRRRARPITSTRRTSCAGDNTFFVATGVTDGELASGVR
ncbi:MAG: class II fructose-bisphosphatase [Schumannella sp.]